MVNCSNQYGKLHKTYFKSCKSTSNCNCNSTRNNSTVFKVHIPLSQDTSYAKFLTLKVVNFTSRALDTEMYATFSKYKIP